MKGGWGRRQEAVMGTELSARVCQLPAVTAAAGAHLCSEKHNGPR